MIHEFGHDLGMVRLLGSAPNEDPGILVDPNDEMRWGVNSTRLIRGASHVIGYAGTFRGSGKWSQCR